MPDTRLRTGTLRAGLRVLARGVRDEPRLFTLAVVGSAVYGVGTAATGWALGRVTGQVVQPALTPGGGQVTAGDVWLGGATLAGITLLTAAGVVARRALAGMTMYALQARYRRRVTRQYLRLPLAWHHRHPTGQLLSNANADVEATWQVFAPLPFALGVLVMLVVAGAAMLAADPVLAGIGLVVLPTVAVVTVFYQRRISPLVTRAQQLRADVSDVAHESFDGAQVVKALGREGEETARFAVQADRLRDANVAVGRMRGVFDPMIEALPTLGTLAVLWVGVSRVAAGDAQIADLVTITFLLTLMAFPIRAIGWVLGELPRTVVGWDRVSHVLRSAGALEHGTASLEGGAAAGLAVRGVGYAHVAQDGEEATVLHDVTLDVTAGSTVAVVGATGSGKSTLAGLLVRLVDPRDGAVVLDGVDLREVRQGGVAGAASLVPQGAFVFDDTVRGNVALGLDEPGTTGRATVDDDAVWAALRLARAEGFVAALPDGLDTRVGERGASLSGGQRQRIAIARALVRRPRLLVLDDATSAVDPRVEAEILAGLRREGTAARDGDGTAAPDRGSDGDGGAVTAGPGTTVVVVAYRKATISLADEVVVLDRGRVTARGTHADLTARVPAYARLVQAYDRDADERDAQRRAAEDAR